jgi:hypothetical protein
VVVEWRSGLFIRHLQEQQKRELFNVITIRQPIVSQNVAIIPKLLNQLFGHKITADYADPADERKRIVKFISYPWLSAAIRGQKFSDEGFLEDGLAKTGQPAEGWRTPPLPTPPPRSTAAPLPPRRYAAKCCDKFQNF